jgi:hypothetical protein
MKSLIYFFARGRLRRSVTVVLFFPRWFGNQPCEALRPEFIMKILAVVVGIVIVSFRFRGQRKFVALLLRHAGKVTPGTGKFTRGSVN